MTEHKRTDELKVGDAVRCHGPRTVTYTQKIRGGDVLVVLDDGFADRFDPASAWDLLTDEELATAQAAARTEGMAQALEHAAQLIRKHQLPAPRYGVSVSPDVLDTIAELEQWASALGARVERGGGDGTIPVVRASGVAESGGVRLAVHVQALEPWPADEQADEDGDGPVDGCECEDCDALVDDSEDLRTPDQWLQHPDFAGTNVIDPDGWRRDGLPWSEPLDRQEFERRLYASTISAPAGAGATGQVPSS